MTETEVRPSTWSFLFLLNVVLSVLDKRGRLGRGILNPGTRKRERKAATKFKILGTIQDYVTQVE